MVSVEEIHEGDSSPTVPRSQERLLDAEEIERAAANMTRPTARMHLEALAKKLRKESEGLKRVEASTNGATSNASNTTTNATSMDTTTTTAPVTPPSKVDPPPVVSPNVSYVPIDKFAFDAGGYNSQFVTLYIDLPGVGSLDKDLITCNFQPDSLDLIVKNLNGKSYRLFKDNLEHDLDAANCKLKIKADKILVKLAKVKSDYGSYDHWSELNAKKKRKSGQKENPADGIMDMMKEMYESGDDNMRKIIGETMMKQRTGELDKNMGAGNMDF